MPLLCAVQSWKESRTAQINKIVRYPGSQPREVEFTIIDRDGTHLEGMFYIPDGFDTSILHQGAAEIWTVELGARQSLLAMRPSASPPSPFWANASEVTTSDRSANLPALAGPPDNDDQVRSRGERAFQYNEVFSRPHFRICTLLCPLGHKSVQIVPLSLSECEVRSSYECRSCEYLVIFVCLSAIAVAKASLLARTAP